MQKLAHLELKEYEALHNYFIKSQKMSTRLEYSREHLPAPFLNAMVLNELPKCYEHFVTQETFNSANSFVELRTGRINYDESREHTEIKNDNDSQLAMTSI